MKGRRLFWQIFPTLLLLAISMQALLAWWAHDYYKTSTIRGFKRELSTHVRIVEKIVEGTGKSRDDLVDICNDIRLRGEFRLTLIRADGVVLADSDEEATRMDNHIDRDEIRMVAHPDRVATSIRFSDTVRRDLMYAALNTGRDPVRYIRLALPLDVIDEHLQRMTGQLLIGSSVTFFLSVVFSLLVARRISQPIETLRSGAEKFARGELMTPLDPVGSLEIQGLGQTLNDMADQLHRQFEDISRQSNEQGAMLASMMEGVLAVNVEERIISANRAACQMLDIQWPLKESCHVTEVIRSAPLQELVTETLRRKDYIERDITIHNQQEEIALQVRGTPLESSGGAMQGALVVLNDVTRLRKLERVRQEFVANVSHELRTPITSIKGFVETLLDGAIDDKENARPFLAKVKHHANRLNNIIEDLLSLSRIEQEGDEVEVDRGNIKDVVRSAIQNCEMKAQERRVDINNEVTDPVPAMMNRLLLEQALINLVDNAIKYSEEGTAVTVSQKISDDHVSVLVRDRGPGIAPEHQERLFERFYRIDKARSRSGGGTGLGLALVKHIAILHGGSVTVESRPGEGSTFTLTIPRANNILTSF